MLAASCGGRSTVGAGTGGAGGAGGAEAACTGPADPRLVVAPQRILLLTLPQVVSTVEYLLGGGAAERVRSSQELEISPDSRRRFPPSGGDDAAISEAAVVSRDQVGQIVGQYLHENFATVTKCATATDACALDFLNTLATRAYRRDPTPDERAALRDLYAELREQEINGYRITATVEEATQYALYALITSPQLLWRYEVGPPGAAPAADVRLSEDELASAVSFFLTDGPPDDQLLAAVRSGTLFATLDQHIARILDTPMAHRWLRSVIEIYFELNQLPVATQVGDWTGLPGGLLDDMQTEARLFLEQVLWQEELNALVDSRVTFLNAGLATAIYDVPAPAGASDTAFVTTLLPSDRRAGLLTNAGFLAASGLSGKVGVGVRGQQAAAAFLCMTAPPLTTPGPVLDQQTAEIARLGTTTAQQQVGARRKAECLGCHATMDALGVVLDAYDGFGRYRTVDARGEAIDARTPLPPILGSGTADGAVAMAEAIARSPAFVDCMARVVLQQAMTDASTVVEVPLPEQQAGCAVADVATRFAAGNDQTFAALVRATAASPAFVQRRVTP